MAIFISILLFSLLMAAISFYGYRRYARPARVLSEMEIVDIALESDELKRIGIGAVRERQHPGRTVVGIRELTGIEIDSEEVDAVGVGQIRSRSGKPGNIAGKVRWIDQDQ